MKPTRPSSWKKLELRSASSAAAFCNQAAVPRRKLEQNEMGILAWIVLGLIAGFIGSKIVNHTGSGILMDIVLGVVGALVGGFLFSMFGAVGVTGFNIYSMLVAVVGAVVVLWLYHMLIGRRAL
jgi:uncharacterized membrane protein YeaQ/YmgE (transglycosylase-associated protein family)